VQARKQFDLRAIRSSQCKTVRRVAAPHFARLVHRILQRAESNRRSPEGNAWPLLNFLINSGLGRVRPCSRPCPTLSPFGNQSLAAHRFRAAYLLTLSDSPTCPTPPRFLREKRAIARSCRTPCRTMALDPPGLIEVRVSDCRASDRVPGVGRR
jgi:hypothetical protein